MKVCPSIAPVQMKDAILQLRRAAKYSELVEIRTDALTDVDLKKLLSRPRPKVIITNRRAEEGGRFNGTASQQFELLSQAIRSGAEYVDVEMSWGKAFVKELLFSSSKTKLICSYHNFQSTPSDLTDIYDSMRKTGAHILKLCTMAKDIIDNQRMFAVLHRATIDRQHVIAFCMGEKGQISRILGGKYGSFLTFGSVRRGDCTGPGQLTIADLKNIFRVHTFTKRTRIFGLVGNPVKHSQGIYYHNRRFTQRSINAVYVNFLVNDISRFITSFRDQISGVSITMPFKQDILPLLDEIDKDAIPVQTINTVINRKGKLVGYNTDLSAIESLLRKKTNLMNKRVTVLGTGSTAKAMAYACIRQGAATTVVGRSSRKARGLAHDLGCSWTTIDNLELVSADILLNGTPVGMATNDSREGTLIPKRYLRRGMIVFDAVYNPSMTQLLLDAKSAGCTIIFGTELFQRQARLQSKLFMDSCS